MMKLKGLTDVVCRNAKYSPEGTGNKRADADGLYLELVPSGAKKWRLKYRFNGKENRLSFGEYPLIGLAEAREKRMEARKLLLVGVDCQTAR